jgi:protein-tyrosine phosphatase
MFRVLFVCTGNRCRSPFAAASFAKLTRGLPVEVESAGTADLGPVPPTVDAIRVAGSHGADVTRHSARSLDQIDASGFDLVIGFERAHVAAAVVEGGARYERAFLLPELERLLAHVEILDVDDPLERARAVLSAAHEARTGFIPGEEVDDPIGRPLRKYQEVFADIDELNEGIVDSLFPEGAAAHVDAPTTEARPLVSAADSPAPIAAARLWGEPATEPVPDADGSDPALEEPVAEAEPAAHESPIPEATST